MLTLHRGHFPIRWAALSLLLAALPVTALASSTADITFSCFGFFNNVSLEDPHQASLSHAEMLTPGGGTANLEGAGLGNIATASTPPTQGASGSLDALDVTLLPSDRCVVNGGNILLSRIFGVSTTAPQSSGTADAIVRFSYSGLHEYEDLAGDADWKAAASVFLFMPPSRSDSFEVASSSKTGLSMPAGFSAQDVSVGGRVGHLITGTVEIEATSSYGPSAMNELEVTHFGGGSFDGFSLSQGGESMVSGSASWNGLTTLTYEVVSMDPDVDFSLTALPEPGAVLQLLAAFGTIGAVASLRGRHRGV